MLVEDATSVLLNTNLSLVANHVGATSCAPAGLPPCSNAPWCHLGTVCTLTVVHLILNYNMKLIFEY